MKQHILRTAGFTAAALVAIFMVSSINTRRVRADDDDRESRIRIGFRIAPVPLNLDHKDPRLVGYGSYLVNAVGDCNGCHTANPATEYLPTGNPFFGAKAIVNTATYLGGGQDFGQLIPGSAHIISRNLTPDKTGRPEGGHTYREFREIMRHGTDMDHVHPTCEGDHVDEHCIPKPFDGSLLQVMPWPTYQNQSDEELRAIYEYLSAIPCIAGPPAPDVRHNDCN